MGVFTLIESRDPCSGLGPHIHEAPLRKRGSWASNGLVLTHPIAPKNLGDTMPIAAECGACHKRFKAPDKLAGKRVKCPQCGGVIQVPAPQAPVVEKPAAASLLDEEQVPKSAAPAAAAAAAPAAAQCPSCGAPLAAKAVLCVSCGHDLRTGQKVESKPPPIPTTDGPQVTLGKKDWDQEEKKKTKGKKKKKKKRRGDLPQGIAFLRGLAVSFGSGLIGSFMWLALFYFFGIEMYIIAWVLGGLAGVGMMIGYGHEDVLAGLGAAAMAFLAVYAAQVMMAAATIADPAHFFEVYTGQDPDELAEEFEEDLFDQGMPQDDEVYDDEGPEEGFEEEGMPEDGEMAGEEGATEGEEELTEEEVAARQELEDLAEGASFVGIIVGGIAKGTVWTFAMFLSLFGLFSLGLALATAYQVGTGGSWLEGD